MDQHGNGYGRTSRLDANMSTNMYPSTKEVLGLHMEHFSRSSGVYIIDQHGQG
jgi:hypothetical protein